jgi:hypothetical protein
MVSIPSIRLQAARSAAGLPLQATSAASSVSARAGLTELQGFAEQLRAHNASLAADGKFDVLRQPFKIVFEVKGSQSTLSRTLAGTNWTVQSLHGDNHNSGGDCSHKDDGGGSAFVRLQSPSLSLGAGGLESISAVIQKLLAQKVSIGKTAAMRILLERQSFERSAVGSGPINALANMHLCNEDILFRLGQGGGAGRSLDHKKSFCAPASSYSARTTTDWSRMLGARHGCINNGTSGYYEFRYFDSSLDDKAVCANVCLLIGMAAAARASRSAGTTPHTIAEYNKEVPRDRWNALLDATVGYGPLRAQLERQFVSSKGKLPPPLSNAQINVVSSLMSQGYRLDGVTKPVDANTRLAQGQALGVTSPRGRRWEVEPDQMPLCLAMLGRQPAELPSEARERLSQAESLASSGATLMNAAGAVLNGPEAAYELQRGDRVQLRFGAHSVQVSDKNEAGTLPLPIAAHIPASDWRTMGTLGLRVDGAFAPGASHPPETPAAAAWSLQFLRGCQFVDAAGRARLGAAALGAGETVTVVFPSGTRVPLAPQDAPLVAGAAPQRAQPMLDAAAWLRGHGGFKLWVGAAEPAGEAELLAAITGGELSVQDPSGGRIRMAGESDFLQRVEQLHGIERLSEKQQGTLDELGQGIGKKFDMTCDGQSVRQLEHVPWMLFRGADVRLVERGVRGAEGIRVPSWESLQAALDVEAGRCDGERGALLGRLAELQKQGVQFHYCQNGVEGAAIGLRGALLARLDEGVVARLPSPRFWDFGFRDRITLRGSEQVAELSRKFGI